MNKVTDSKSNTNLCSGCGACSVICPRSCIEIIENETGELRPVVSNDCVNCGRCISVCPFENHIDLSADFEKCYIGVAEEYEPNSSSGGVALWFFNKLLLKGIVDSVICVSAKDDSNQLFDYIECHTSEELKACRGSAYYPVSFGEILGKINDNNRIAIIGVPCFVNAIRNLMKSDSSILERVVCVAGLVCGHMPNKRMVDCLAWSQNKTRSDIVSCDFRLKDSERPAWDYGVKLKFNDGSEYGSFGSDDFGFLFWKRLFSQECCNHCSDVFANNADITFMDAWLPEYKEEKNGTSMIICRNSDFARVLDELSSDGWIKEVELSKSIEAQKALCEYKSNAGNHKRESELQKVVRDICNKNYEDPQIIDVLKRVVYKQKLKNENPIMWFGMEIKDRLFKK